MHRKTYVLLLELTQANRGADYGSEHLTALTLYLPMNDDEVRALLRSLLFNTPLRG